MPFMIGRQPIRRTLKYLEAGKLYLKNNIQVMSINYNTFGEPHNGARQFVFWYLPQVQYKNPNVQIVTLKNITPTPFIRCYYDNGKEMLIDIDSKTREEILKHLISVVGKSQDELGKETMLKEKKANIANFGVGCSRSCMCVVPGQVPCPGLIPLPYCMRGKNIYQNKDE